MPAAILLSEAQPRFFFACVGLPNGRFQIFVHGAERGIDERVARSLDWEGRHGQSIEAVGVRIVHRAVKAIEPNQRQSPRKLGSLEKQLVSLGQECGGEVVPHIEQRAPRDNPERAFRRH
jgi:hypothetical protein